MEKQNLQLRIVDKNISVCVRGIAALYIMLTHLIHIGIWQIEIFSWGYLFVGVFFFYSGFGLEYSTHHKADYLHGFVKKKVLKIYVPFLIAETCYTICTHVIYKSYTLMTFLLSCIGVMLSNPVLWYVIEIIIIYIVFLIKQKLHLPNFLYIPMWIIFGLVVSYYNLGSWWYISSGCFILGVYTVKINQNIKIIDLFSRKSFCAFIICLWGCLDFLSRFISNTYTFVFGIPASYLVVLLMILASLLFIVVLASILQIVPPNIVFKFRKLGNISFEIYLWHMFFALLVSSIIALPQIEYMLLVSACTIVFCSIYHFIQSKVIGVKLV